jgi:hypothetical protein
MFVPGFWILRSIAYRDWVAGIVNEKEPLPFGSGSFKRIDLYGKDGSAGRAGIGGIIITGVGDLYNKIGGKYRIGPLGPLGPDGAVVAVAFGCFGLDGSFTGGGGAGAGGAAITGRVVGMQAAVVTMPAIQAKPLTPPGNWIYHQDPSKFFPASGAVAPCGRLPIILYTISGPLRTFATVIAVTIGLQA